MTRERIIEAARLRFFAQGLKETTMDEIASDLGMSKKTLYRHFDGKEALAHAVMERFQAEILSLIEVKRQEIADPVERFETLVVEISRKRAAMNNRFPADIKRLIPDLWRRLEDFRERETLKNMEETLQEGIKKGRIREDINTAVATKVYLAALQGIMQPDALERSGISAEEAFSNISRIFLDGVRRKEPLNR